MEAQEAKLKVQIKKTAKENQLEAARMLARDLVRTRTHITRMYQMRTQMQSVSMQLSSMRNNEEMASTMGNAVRMMSIINEKTNLPGMQNIMMQFEMEHGKMEMTQEMIDDALSETMGADEETQTDDVINKVMDELGLETGSQIGSAAVQGAMPQDPQQNANWEQQQAQLQSRIDNL